MSWPDPSRNDGNGTVAVLRRNPGYHGSRPQHLDALLDIVDDRRGVDYVRRGRLDYFAGSRTASSSVAASAAGRRSQDSTSRRYAWHDKTPDPPAGTRVNCIMVLT